MNTTNKSGDFLGAGWEKNREILAAQYGGLLDEIMSENDDIFSPQEIKIEASSAGEPTLCVRGNYVHSQRDPVREGQRLAQAVDTGSGPVVVLGFGLGYAAQAAAEFNRPVIIVEKYRNLLRTALEQRDFSDFLSKHRIIFVIGASGEGITGALSIAEEIAQSTGEKASVSVIRNKALTALDEQWYKAIDDRIRTWSMRDDVNTATLKRFGRRWVHNLSRNATAIRDYPGVSHLAGIAAGTENCGNIGAVVNAAAGTGPADAAATSNTAPLPVFLAAAGPSLDKTAPLLRDIHDRCIIVAVDTSLRFFIKNGVQPDFVVVVDPQFWNSRHLDRCVSGSSRTKTTLIAESAVYPPVLRLPFENIFLCGSLFPLGAFIENQVDPKGRLAAGGSVATSAWDFARLLGMKREEDSLPRTRTCGTGTNQHEQEYEYEQEHGQEIWIAGLDLAFPNHKTHFRGARFEELSNSQSCRFNPVEKWVLRALRDGIPFKARSSSGEHVLTDRRLSLYAAWFESKFAQHGEVRNLALFQDGLAIKGLHAAQAEELLALPKRRDEIDCRLSDAFSRIEKDFHSTQEAASRAQRYEKAVLSLTRGLESIREASVKGAAIARQAMGRNVSPDQQKKILRDLDALTRRVTDSEVKEVAGFLFPADEGEKAGSGSGDPFREYLESSLKLFSSLAQAVEFNLDLKIGIPFSSQFLENGL